MTQLACVEPCLFEIPFCLRAGWNSRREATSHVWLPLGDGSVILGNRNAEIKLGDEYYSGILVQFSLNNSFHLML
jgi:hypothetical protein